MRVSLRKKFGFTLVELLTVTSIVTVSMSLLLPGLQKVRNQARVAACKNNMKQLGLAMHNYHDTVNAFPPGWVIKETKAAAGSGFGWGAMILPYMDQAPLYTQLNFSLPPAADKSTQTKLPVYLCPDDTAAALNSVRGKFSTSNYSGNAGDQLLPGSVDLPDPGTPAAAKLWTGILYHNSSVRMRDITDGTSNTFMLGEKSITSAAGIWVGVRSNQNADDSVTDCNNGSKVNAVIHSFSSLHGDGANFLLVDGSVKFLLNTIDSKEGANTPNGVYQRLSHKSDGNPIPAF